ncbi:MAG: hypothetical protein ACI9Y7_000563 [Dokdonia sp.]|jgi:hypothetical protein
MQSQSNIHYQAKIINVQTPKKKYSASIIKNSITVLFFGFLINLSLTNENLFLKEILIVTGIVCVLSLAKGATNNYTK